MFWFYEDVLTMLSFINRWGREVPNLNYSATEVLHEAYVLGNRKDLLTPETHTLDSRLPSRIFSTLDA